MKPTDRRVTAYRVAALLLLVFDCVAWCQPTVRGDAVTFVGTVEDAALLKKAVFAVQMQGNVSNTNAAGDWVVVGSGFFVRGTNNILLGVTCKHVVLPFIKAGKNVFIGLDTSGGYMRAPCIIRYIDQTNDIAILAPQGTPETNKQVQSLGFGEDLFDDGSFLVEGRGVLIAGYPLALGIEEGKNHPVMRLGMVAQYTGRDYFLIDGVASHGNSGSPVVAQRLNDMRLIGMVTSHVADKINLLDENLQVAAQLPYNSGLARAITMKVIQQAIRNEVGK